MLDQWLQRKRIQGGDVPGRNFMTEAKVRKKRKGAFLPETKDHFEGKMRHFRRGGSQEKREKRKQAKKKVYPRRQLGQQLFGTRGGGFEGSFWKTCPTGDSETSWGESIPQEEGNLSAKKKKKLGGEGKGMPTVGDQATERSPRSKAPIPSSKKEKVGPSDPWRKRTWGLAFRTGRRITATRGKQPTNGKKRDISCRRGDSHAWIRKKEHWRKRKLREAKGEKKHPEEKRGGKMSIIHSRKDDRCYLGKTVDPRGPFDRNLKPEEGGHWTSQMSMTNINFWAKKTPNRTEGAQGKNLLPP